MLKGPRARLIALVLLLSAACALPPRAPTPIYPSGTGEASGASPTAFLPPQPSPVTSSSAWQIPSSPSPLGGTPTASPSQTPSQSTVDALARRSLLVAEANEVLLGLNQERQALGLPLLGAPAALSGIAFVRAEDMITRNYLGHEDPADGSIPAWSLMVAAGFGGRLAETLFVATGPLDQVAASALATWIASPDHRALLLDPSLRYAGAGLMGDGTWWKLVLLLAEQAPGSR